MHAYMRAGTRHTCTRAYTLYGMHMTVRHEIQQFQYGRSVVVCNKFDTDSKFEKFHGS